MSARAHAWEIFNRLRKRDERLTTVTDAYFIDREVPKREFQRTQVLTREVIRWQRRLDTLIAAALDKPIKKLNPKVLIVLRIGVWELTLDDQIPDYAATDSAVDLVHKKVGRRMTGLVNAVMKRIPDILAGWKENRPSLGIEESYPEWMIDRWKQQFGESVTRRLCRAMNRPVEMVIRRNPNQVTKIALINQLKRDGIVCVSMPGTDRFFRIMRGGNKLMQHDLFKRGDISMQDRGAGAIVEVLNPQPGEIVLDVCAAPGTKTYYIAEQMQNRGQIYASDIEGRRVQQGIADLTRHQTSIVQWEVKDAVREKFPVADAILIDVPCTGTGVIRRKPDIKWRRSAENVREMARQQLELLQNVSQYIKPDGRLVYATCSLETEENWDVVDAFLKLNNQFISQPIREPALQAMVDDRGALMAHPAHHQSDGMFAVVLRRKPAEKRV